MTEESELKWSARLQLQKAESRIAELEAERDQAQAALDGARSGAWAAGRIAELEADLTEEKALRLRLLDAFEADLAAARQERDAHIEGYKVQSYELNRLEARVARLEQALTKIKEKRRNALYDPWAVQIAEEALAGGDTEPTKWRPDNEFDVRVPPGGRP